MSGAPLRKPQSRQSSDPLDRVLHYVATKDLDAGVPTTALCGLDADGFDRTDRAWGAGEWMVCPMCQMVYDSLPPGRTED